LQSGSRAWALPLLRHKGINRGQSNLIESWRSKALFSKTIRLRIKLPQGRSHRYSAVDELVRRHSLMDDSELLGALGVEDLSTEDDLIRLVPTRLAQNLDRHGGKRHPNTEFVRADSNGVSSDAQIARTSDDTSTGDCGSIDSSDCRLWKGEDVLEGRVKARDQPAHIANVFSQQPRKVDTSGKDLTASGQNDGSDVGAPCQLV